VSEQLWYAGLPVVGTRGLAPEELEQIDGLIANGWRWSAASALLVVVLVVVAFITTSTVTTLFALLAFRAVLTQVPAFASPLTIRGLLHDRAQGIVYLCESAGDDELAAAVIEVLPQSRVILRRGGQPPPDFQRARLTTTAVLPEHAAAAANFVRPIDGNEQVLVHQRPLSAGELRELDGYAPAVATVRVVLAAVAAAGAVATMVLAAEGRLTSLLLPFVFATIALVTGVSTFRAWKLRRRVAQDVGYGYVLIVRIRDGETLSVPHEFLPHSRILWTSAGEPANWRKVVSAR
jgi:hypothetical protein